MPPSSSSSSPSPSSSSSSPSPSSAAPTVLQRALIDISAGTIAGVGITLVGHPFDTLKVRLQTQSHSNPQYSGLVDCVQQTFRKEGFSGFYRGVASPLLGQMLFNAVQFVAYGEAKQLVVSLSSGQQRRKGPTSQADMTLSQFFAAGALTGGVVAFVEGPIDLFKTQLQTQVFLASPRFTTLPQTVSYIVRNSGLRGVYQGLGPTVLRNVPAVSFYFGVYEATRRALAERRGVSLQDLHPSELLTAGATGGVAYWIFTYPIDSIKSMLMSESTHLHERKNKTIVQAAQSMYREAGIARFFKGITPCLLRAAPANAVCFLLYEESVKQLNKML